MPTFDRFNEPSTEIQLDFVEREATPRELVRLNIPFYLRSPPYLRLLSI